MAWWHIFCPPTVCGAISGHGLERSFERGDAIYKYLSHYFIIEFMTGGDPRMQRQTAAAIIMHLEDSISDGCPDKISKNLWINGCARAFREMTNLKRLLSPIVCRWKFKLHLRWRWLHQQQQAMNATPCSASNKISDIGCAATGGNQMCDFTMSLYNGRYCTSRGCKKQ